MIEVKKTQTLIVPPIIRLLFDNNQLDIMKILCLLYTLYKKNKKKFYIIDDVMFYYSLVNFNMINLFESNGDEKNINRNLYYKFIQNINKIILELYNLGFIDVKGDISTKKQELGIKLTNNGDSFVSSLNIEYFTNLDETYLNMMSKVENSIYNKNKVKGILK